MVGLRTDKFCPLTLDQDEPAGSSVESFYEVAHERVSELLRAVIGFPAVVVVDQPFPLGGARSLRNRIDFTEAHLVASAEASGVSKIASFGGSI